MQSNPLWPVEKRFPKLEKDTETDIVIVGGGIAGISSAYFLKQEGKEVIVLEKNEVGNAATGASSGILYYGTGTNYLDAVKLYGEKKAEMIWKETRETIQLMQKLVQENAIECGYRKIGAIMTAKNPEQKEYLQKEFEEMQKMNFPTKQLSSTEIKEYFTLKEFVSGLLFEEVSQIHPALFASNLARKFNIKIFELSAYKSHKKEKDSIIVETPNAKIKCKKLLFTTNLEPLFGLEKHFSSESSIIIASQLMNIFEIQKIWPKQTIIWGTEEEYDIIYPVMNRTVLELFKAKQIKEKILDYYGESVSSDKQWGDSWSKTKDLLPIAGKIEENVFAAIAMGDQGIVTAFTIARKISKLFKEEKDAFLEISSKKRLK